MATFFHEIGHTISAWFYGYPTIPMFDFQNGGGLALSISDQQIIIIISIWAAIAYGIYIFQENNILKTLLIMALIMNISFIFTDHHLIIINFTGPLFESLIGSYMIYRALFNLAPRGSFERFLNSFFGFGLIFQVFVESYGLLKSYSFRLMYYEQKESHGFGDFDKIANSLQFIGFNGVVYIWIFLNIICLAVPFIVYLMKKENSELNKHDY